MNSVDVVTPTCGARRAALGELEGVSVGAQRLLLVAVQQFLQRAEAPLGSAQDELSRLALHDLAVLVLHHRLILQMDY